MAKIDINKTISGAKHDEWIDLVDSYNEKCKQDVNRPPKATKSAKNVLFHDKSLKSAHKEPLLTQNAIKERYTSPYKAYGDPTIDNPNLAFKNKKKKEDMLKLINNIGVRETDSQDDTIDW